MCAAVLTTLTPVFLLSFSDYLSYFILAVPMFGKMFGKCLGKYSCRGSIFPIEILNGTCFFVSEMVLALAEASHIKN